MGKINWGRVIAGGLLAGLVINVGEFLLNAVLMADQFEAAMAELGLTPEMGARTMAVWIAYGFVLGIAAVWLYAAIRPRYGRGPKTAVIAGLAVWFLDYFLVSVGMWNMGLFAGGLLATGAVWGLVELLIATVLGAWVYQET